MFVPRKEDHQAQVRCIDIPTAAFSPAIAIHENPQENSSKSASRKRTPVRFSDT